MVNKAGLETAPVRQAPLTCSTAYCNRPPSRLETGSRRPRLLIVVHCGCNLRWRHPFVLSGRRVLKKSVSHYPSPNLKPFLTTTNKLNHVWSFS